MTKKMISIRPDQAKWITDNYFNLSKFVQNKLDERMQKSEEKPTSI